MVIKRLTEDQRQHWEREGYVIVRNAVDDDLVQALVAAIERIIDRALAGEFGDSVRWIHEEHRLPHFLSNLLAPDKYDPAFGEFLENIILPSIDSLLNTPVWCSWLMALTGGADYPYSLQLHRDNNEVGGPDEMDLIEQFRMKQCYFQAPLLPDDRFLQVVPGSHLRRPTEAEKAAATRLHASSSEDVPGLTTIELQPGDVVYRHTNLLHQGFNPDGRPRWTLVSGLWADTLPIPKVEEKHYAELNIPGFVDALPSRLQASVMRYLGAYEQSRAAIKKNLGQDACEALNDLTDDSKQP